MRRRRLTEGHAHHLLVHRRLEEGVGALRFWDRFRHRLEAGWWLAPTGQALREERPRGIGVARG